MQASRLRLQARDDGAIFVDEHFQLRNARPREREASVGFVALKRQVAQRDLLRSQLNSQNRVHLSEERSVPHVGARSRPRARRKRLRATKYGWPVGPAALCGSRRSFSAAFNRVSRRTRSTRVARAQRVALGPGLSFRQGGLEACARDHQPPRPARNRGRREQSQKGGGQKPEQKENRRLYQGRLKPPSMKRTIARRRAEAKRGSPSDAKGRRTTTFRMGSRSRGA